jgi:hypothetical protein
VKPAANFAAGTADGVDNDGFFGTVINGNGCKICR